MEDLTSLVKGMNVSSSDGDEEGLFDAPSAANVGNKRKKISLSPEAVPSSSSFGGMVNEEEDVVMMSSFPSVDDTLLEDSAAADLLLPDLTPSSSLLPSTYSSPVLSRSSSLNGVAASAAASGGDFVDELFNAFATEEGQPSSQQHQQQVMMMENPNKPDAELMKRIEDSLSTIPKTMHEMVANRLIDAIAEGNKDISACSSSSLSSSISPNAAMAIKKEDTHAAAADVVPEAGTSSTSSSSTIPLPLAVATLKTILADYGLKVESCGSNSEDAMVHRRMSNKSLPLVPMHA